MGNKKVTIVFLVAMAGWTQSPPGASSQSAPAAATQSASGSQSVPATPTVEIASSNETKTTFSTRVNLVVVPVVVRDRKGRAVGNLTKEDFQLFDKGKLQTITRFSVEKAGEKTAIEATQIEAAAAAGEPSSVVSANGSAAIPTRFVAY